MPLGRNRVLEYGVKVEYGLKKLEQGAKKWNMELEYGVRVEYGAGIWC
jgi:hypothetical protein